MESCRVDRRKYEKYLSILESRRKLMKPHEVIFSSVLRIVVLTTNVYSILLTSSKSYGLKILLFIIKLSCYQRPSQIQNEIRTLSV